MTPSPELFTQIAALAVVLSGVSAGVVMFSLGKLFKDSMILRIGIASIFIAFSRLLTVFFPTFDDLWRLSPWVPVLFYSLRAIGAWYLITGSLNGDIRHKSTKPLLLFVLILSGVTGLMYEHYSIASFVLPILIGWAFAADRFWNRCGMWRRYNDPFSTQRILRNPCIKATCSPYCVLALFFILRAVLALLNALWTNNLELKPYSLLAVALVNVAMLPWAVKLSFCRHKIVMNCDKRMKPVSRY